MNRASGHITDAQIQEYVTGPRTSPDAHQWLDAHLEDCESCLGRLLEAERRHLGLLEGDTMKGTPYPGCPAEETLQQLAAGICASDTAERTVQHAAHCDYCGPLLSLYLKELSDDVSDAALLAQLESSTPRWQKNFIREHLVKEKPQSSSIFSIIWNGFWPRLATATAGIAAVVGGLFFYLRPDDLSRAQKLVAAAYGERRTTEMRLPGVPWANYSPVSVQRAGEPGLALSSQPSSLLRARADVDDKLKSSSNLDPRWLELEGRIELLEATPASAKGAQGVLEKAQAEGLTNPSLQIDLAASYFERAHSEQNPDLSPTINRLRSALDHPKISDQERLAALFDLAIAYQESRMFDFAMSTWEQYLKLDSSSDWAKEARERLAAAKKAGSPPRNQSRLEMQKPPFFLNHLSDPDALEHLDIYQDFALRFWLPQLVREPRGASSQAGQKLAELLAEHDSDSWLKEFLSSLQQKDAPAVDALSAAIRANRRGLYELGVEQSKLAASAFVRQGNLPGELMARFQSVYASQRFLEGFDCLTQLASVQAPDRYRWLQIQLALEKYTCSNFGGDFAAIEQGLESSRRKAEESHLYILSLRAAALEASIKRQQQPGCREVWEQIIHGLNNYWRYSADRPESLYEFYSVLEQCAAQTRLWHAAETLQRRSVSLVQSANQDDDANLILEGMAHAELAAILSAEYKDAEADVEQKAADILWNRVRSERTADTYRLVMRIHRAEIQLDRGAARSALLTLSSSRALLTTTQYELLSLDFYRVLGKTYWQLHRLSDAASGYADGIKVAESSLRSIQSGDKERLRWITKIDEVYRGLTRVWIDQGKTAEAWKLWEWYRTRSLQRETGLRGLSPLTRPSLETVETEIARVSLPSAPHLVYASFQDGLEAWTIDATGIRPHWIPIRQSDLEHQVNDFAERCANPSSLLNEVHLQAQKLYSLLVQPIASDLPQSGIVIAETDKALSRLVLPALMAPDGRYFAETHTVVYSPGVLVEKSLRPALPIQAGDRLLLLDASPSQGAGVVPGHLEEREAALRIYSHVALVNGDQTNPAEIRRELSRSTVFDFIGHGEQRQSHTELRLNPRTSLTTQDFPPQALAHLKLSILAACSTGAAGDDRLLDTENLVHPFLAAGVPEVIASQWNVDSAATTRLMQILHAHLGTGEPVPQAMYRAQKEILAVRNHPYFWAGFNVSGRAN